ncbi:hypothetical protein BDY21DRAFT_376451, partial [Lineolata rhizophorae]
MVSQYRRQNSFGPRNYNAVRLQWTKNERDFSDNQAQETTDSDSVSDTGTSELDDENLSRDAGSSASPDVDDSDQGSHFEDGLAASNQPLGCDISLRPVRGSNELSPAAQTSPTSPPSSDGYESSLSGTESSSFSDSAYSSETSPSRSGLPHLGSKILCAPSIVLRKRARIDDDLDSDTGYSADIEDNVKLE